MARTRRRGWPLKAAVLLVLAAGLAILMLAGGLTQGNVELAAGGLAMLLVVVGIVVLWVRVHRR